MSARAAAVPLALAALLFTAPAAGAQERTITTVGVGTAKVGPVKVKNDRSIALAVAGAHRAALPLALEAARTEAELVAGMLGVKLGSVLSVSEEIDQRFNYYGPPGFGPFGPGPKYCGTVRRAVRGKARPGERRGRIIRFDRRRVCRIPPAETVSLYVTFAVA